MPLTLQVTAVLDVPLTVAEIESVSPSNTLPDAGVMLTVICGGGGGVMEPPPPPPPQAVRETPRARTKSVRRWRATSDARSAIMLGFNRICGRGRMFLTKADRGPAQSKGRFARPLASGKNLCVF